MIFLVGDIHGFYQVLQKCNRFATPEDIIIQVGDFGVDRNTANVWNQLYPAVICPVFFIGGNHENYDIIDEWSKTEITKVANGLFHIPRGAVLEMRGYRIGFLGGAESVDKAYRNSPGEVKTWWEQERIQEEDVERLVSNVGTEPLDVLIVHCPPPITVLSNFPMLDTQSWGLPSNWVDISSQRVRDAVYLTKPRYVFCGHMHKKVIHHVDGDPKYTVRILDINEVVCIDDVYPSVEGNP